MHQFAKILHVAATSPSKALKAMAPAPLQALATMSYQDGKVLNHYGAMRVMLDLITNAEAPVGVQADAFECVAKLVQTDARARVELLELGGLDLLIDASKHWHQLIRKHGLQVLFFLHHTLLCVCVRACACGRRRVTCGDIRQWSLCSCMTEQNASSTAIATQYSWDSAAI